MSVDYAFSDDETMPEGWPELDFDEFLLGEWVDGKKPASLEARGYLAELVRLFRASLPARPAATRQADLRFIRESYRAHRSELVALETSLLDLRRRMLPFLLAVAAPEGGVQ